MDKILTLPLELQIGLGGGFLAYMIASTGLRRGHTAIDVLMRSLAFGLPGILLFHFLTPLLGAEGLLLAGMAAVVLSVALGAGWRRWFREWWGEVMKRADVHRDDGLLTAWDRMLASRNFKVSQVKATLLSGRELHLEDVEALPGGLPYDGLIVGTDGDLVMVTDKERSAAGEVRQRSDVHDEEWGTRFTYIPASQLETVEFRCLPLSPSKAASASANPASTPDSRSSPATVDEAR